MQKVLLSKAWLTRGCDPDIKKHHWREEKVKGSCDLTQVRIYENEFRAMQHATADAYRANDHESCENPSGGAIALLKPEQSQGQ